MVNANAPSHADHLANAVKTAVQANDGKDDNVANSNESPSPQPFKIPPKSWADLVRTRTVPQTAPNDQASVDAIAQTNGFVTSKTGSLADALTSYDVENNSDSAKLAFLEPRGLVNTGNMCYMNSVSSFCSCLE